MQTWQCGCIKRTMYLRIACQRCWCRLSTKTHNRDLQRYSSAAPAVRSKPRRFKLPFQYCACSLQSRSPGLTCINQGSLRHEVPLSLKNSCLCPSATVRSIRGQIRSIRCIDMSWMKKKKKDFPSFCQTSLVPKNGKNNRCIYLPMKSRQSTMK